MPGPIRWYMPLNIFITFAVGSILGWDVIHLTKAPAHLRGLILGCCSAGNLGYMPLIIISAVCKEKSSPFGNPDVCLKYGMAYVSLSLVFGSVYMWSYVYNIVRISSKRAIKQAEANGSRNGATNEVLNTSQENIIELPVPPKDNSPSDDRENGFALPYSITNEKVEMTNSVNLEDRLRTLARKMNLKKILAPSTIGAGDTARVIQTLTFMTRINTLLQTWFGSRLPTVMGSPFAFIIPVMSVMNDFSDNVSQVTIRFLVLLL